MQATATVNRKQLVQAIARMTKITKGNKAKPPTLTNATFSLNGNLKICGTDQEIHQTETIDVKSVGVGVVCIKPEQFRKFLTTIKTPTIDIGVIDGQLTIGSTRLSCNSHSPADIPVQPTVTPVATRQLSAHVLLRLLTNTVYCCDTESSWYALSGILVEMDTMQTVKHEPTYIRLVATDRRRLATDYTGSHTGKLLQAILPIKAAKQLIAALKDADSCELSIAFSKSDNEHKYFFALITRNDGTQTTIVATELEGRFPPWGDVIPQDYVRVCNLDANKLSELLQQAKPFITDNTPGVDISVNDNLLTLSTHTELGHYFGETAVNSEGGVALTITLNQRFLDEFTSRCTNMIVTIKASPSAKHRPESMILFSVTGTPYQCAVMPLHKPSMQKGS